jgi:hypothetical protein
MGLDQYLYAKQYLSPSNWMGEERNEQYHKVVNAVGASTMVYQDLPAAQVEIKVAYWRKSNQIHAWFVENCQNGEDDCREAYVSREQLMELIDLCKRVLADNSLAEELLPSQAGFFFGSTEYDEWYFGDIEQTVTMLETVLRETPEDWTFAYQSSW